MNEGCSTEHLIKTDDGSITLKHPLHGEAYHSFAGASTEAKDLYIHSSGFVEALKNTSTLEVLDVGLGLGYNALFSIQAWLEAPVAPDVFLTSLEHDGDLLQQLFSGQSEWQ